MDKICIMLNSINDVKDFVNKILSFNCDVDLISGRYVVDAKSIMGIFSLDLTHPIEVKIIKDEYKQEFIDKFSNFLVK